MPSDNVLPKLGILYDSTAKFSPSNPEAINKFIEAATKVGFTAEILAKEDIYKLASFDALLIRDTTEPRHYTHAFALWAKTLNMPCIDDVDSLLKCTDKIEMHNIFTEHHIPTPKTITNIDINSLLWLGFPIVIKETNSCFSRGVHKVDNKKQLYNLLYSLAARGRIKCVAQEFVPTDFDWRIGVLDGKAIFACIYHMTKDDWRIIKYDRSDNYSEGAHHTFQMKRVPKSIINLAEQTANAIGNGLYGVDIKVIGDKPLVIEINDNPSIDAGVEDEVLGDELYYKIIKYLYDKIQK